MFLCPCSLAQVVWTSHARGRERGKGEGVNLTNCFHMLSIRNHDYLLGVYIQSCLYIVIDQRHVSDGVQSLQGIRKTVNCISPSEHVRRGGQRVSSIP